MVRVADYIADFIYKQGVSDVFMLTGGGSIYLDDGVACNKNLKVICVRSEATAPMMAEAYSRLNHELGVVYVTTGPGGTNAISGLVEAWVDSAPILIISGQVQRNLTSYNSGIKNLRSFGIQELNIIEIVKSITKYAEIVNDPGTIRYHLEKAVHLAKSGRPGPVWLDIPLDVQSARVNEFELEGYIPLTKRSEQDVVDCQIKNVFNLLKSSNKPLFIGGGGIRSGKTIDEFKELIDISGIPVIFSRLGQDILPFSHKNNLGHGGIKGQYFTSLVMKECDLVISVGSRLSVPFAGEDLNMFSKDARIVMVDVDEAELKRVSMRVDIAIQIDVKLFILKLLDAMKDGRLPEYNKWLNRCCDYKEKYPIVTSSYKRNPIDLYYFISRLDVLSRENNIFVSDAGSAYYVTGQGYRFEKGQREITSGAFASMGLTIPLAIGCAVADKDAQILAVTGDGSLELNIQELKTLSSYHLNVKLFVINNGGYVSIRNTQDILCEGRYIGSDQANCDEILNFQKVADAFDLPYFLIGKHKNVDSGILEVMNKKGPVLVEVVCDSKQKIIESAKTIEELENIFYAGKD